MTSELENELENIITVNSLYEIHPSAGGGFALVHDGQVTTQQPTLREAKRVAWRLYWGHVENYGVPPVDRDAITCEGDSGYGPCGTYSDWGNGRCKSGHKITFDKE